MSRTMSSVFVSFSDGFGVCCSCKMARPGWRLSLMPADSWSGSLWSPELFINETLVFTIYGTVLVMCLSNM